MLLWSEESELDRGNGELGKGGNGETVEGVSWKLKFESLGEMCGKCRDFALVLLRNEEER